MILGVMEPPPPNNGVSFPPHLLLSPGPGGGGGPLLPSAPVNARDGSAIPEELLVGDLSGSLKCEYCPYRVSKKDRMRRHVNTVHYKERPFRCHLCDSTFGRKDKIKRHLETVHSAERPYKCEFCAHTSGRKDKIKEHVQSVHFKLRPPKSHKKKATSSSSPSTPTTVATTTASHQQTPLHQQHLQIPTQVTPQTIAPQYVQAILQTQSPLIPQTSIITKPENLNLTTTFGLSNQLNSETRTKLTHFHF